MADRQVSQIAQNLAAALRRQFQAARAGPVVVVIVATAEGLDAPTCGWADREPGVVDLREQLARAEAEEAGT